jgi:DNA invertase Pin-like site-specific DNA recombinase
MPRALALLRVSTDAQAAGDRAGLPSQRREVEKIAERHGLEVVECVELAGVSGAQVREDPRFVSLLARLAEPGIDGLIVTDFDRLFRRGRFADYGILDAFADTGTVLWTSEGPVDPRQDSDALLSVIRGEIAGMERRRIAERTQRAKEVLRLAGRHVAGDEGLPYGVAYDKAAARWSYLPAEATVVREVYARFLAGERNLSALARELGLVRTLPYKILTQPLYGGVRRILYRYPGRRRVARAPQEVLEQRVIEAPLVAWETWLDVQRRLEARRRPARSTAPALLRGLATCASCGAPLHVHWSREAWGYRCRGGARGGAARCPVEIAGPVVDLIASRVLGERLGDAALLAELLADALRRGAEGAEADAGAAAREAKRLREERERVAVAFERGLRSAEDAARRVRELEAAIRRLEAAAPRAASDPRRLALDLAAPFAEWDFLGLADRRRILAAAVEWVRVRRTGRAQAAVEAVGLTIPTEPSPVPPNGRRRATWGVCGGVLEVWL